MSNSADSQRAGGWLECCGFVQIFRTFSLAVHPTKLVLALAALVLTWSWGSVLDLMWIAADQGVPPSETWTHVAQGQVPESGGEPARSRGVFATWSGHLGWCIESALSSLRHGRLWSSGIEGAWAVPASYRSGVPDSAWGELGALPLGLVPCLGLMCTGTVWVLTQHPLFALLFFVVALAIWALLGGAICRIAAVQFARDEKIGWREAVKFARERFWAGFFISPLLPVVMLLIIAVGLALGGVFLRIPYVGDVLGSLVFFLAILGGFAAALVVIGSVAGGSLFWPTIAAEGSESLDAVSRSFNYVGATPWRTLLYGLVAAVYASLCFLLVRLIVFATLKATHAFVGFGTSPFGWWRVDDGASSKLDLLWTAPTFDQLAPHTALPGGIESFSAWLIGLWVGLAIMLMWAFLASFHLSASTIVYFLLRRDNDAMDLEEVYTEGYEEGEFAPSAAPPEPATAAEAQAAPETDTGVQLTVEGKPAPSPSSDDDDKSSSSEGDSPK